MKHAYTIGDKTFTFETVQQKKQFLCYCIEHPELKATAATSKKAMEACMNLLMEVKGLRKVRITKRVRKIKVTAKPKSKPWWKFW